MTNFAAANFADMAQLVEQRIRNAWVVGSSPIIGSKGVKCQQLAFYTFFISHLFTDTV